jgi:lipopolysaccharide transport system ATP-binding protein
VSDSIIKVENISKRYVIGHQNAKGDGLRHAIENAFRAPQRWFKDRREKRAAATEEFWALKDVSFEIKRGEVVGIIGRNGAGKSTLLKILSRITEPTSGRITLEGRVASLLEVGTGFHQELTGRENIFLNGAILGMSRVEIKRKFDEIVEFSEVEKFLDTPVKRYSSGMYVRLAFAVAAHLEPEILIVDEVLAVGDVTFQNKCLGKMEDIARSHNRTVLFVSHNLGAVRRLCTTGVTLKSGRVTKVGPIDSVLASYGESLSMSGDDMLDHHGRTSVTVKDINLHVNGIKCDSVSSGETVELRIQLEFKESVKQSVRVGIALENMFGVFTVINYSHFHAVTFAPRSSIISATIKDMPLAEGLYRLHLRILSGEEEIYWSMGAKNIRIDGGDFYGTGIRGEENLCPWLQKIEWQQI